MQKHLRDLKPDKFADLIAMNALYRPGPLAYIPNFIKRKHGDEEITYDLPEMEEFLAESYGITGIPGAGDVAVPEDRGLYQRGCRCTA
jgi:DNA polymerase III, alpha subunit (EC 2.7.7.7)